MRNHPWIELFSAQIWIIFAILNYPILQSRQHIQSFILTNIQMVYMTIPEMNRKLEEVSSFFTTRAKAFTAKIELHEGKFREDDFKDFQTLLNEIKREAMERISNFFEERFQVRSNTYQTQISTFASDGDSVKSDLQNFRENLIQTTLQTKQQQSRKQKLMEHFSQKLRRNLILKKCFKILKDNEQERKLAKLKDARMDAIYRRNLIKKGFFPWRTLTYKDGYANTVRQEADKDVHHIQEQYQGIIEILKQKIRQTDEIIKVKKAAKGEFAYALSKNLLKSISNLSLEVMSLNQMSLRDGEWSEESTNKFMRQVDSVIKDKLSKVREYRQGLVEGGIVEDGQGQKKKKHISFA